MAGAAQLLEDNVEYATQTGLEVAVIGMAGRFPGAPDLDTFWRNLLAGQESIRFFGDEELLAAGVDPALASDPNYIPARGILGCADRFDASFFGYSPKEAALMDPQQRLFLETAWNAMEDAGYLGRTYRGRVGVFASVGFNSYLVLNLQVNPRFMQGEDGPQAMLSNDKDFLATRVSYKLNLTGPSVVVQSACSSSLTALHLACQSLIAGEADLQIAGGVTVRVPEQTGYLYQDGMIHSPDGRCRPFDQEAAGTVAGNGIGVVILKRLEDALADRDLIYAVIRATAINNDGDDKVGYAAPSSAGQTQVIRTALALADVSADSIGFVETHGSGTRMGDPIEVEALRNAYAGQARRRQYCALGAVKANIGHLDAAAGIAGFIKTVLALHHGRIPPHPTFREANPLCDLPNSPFYVNTAPVEWRAGLDGRSRRAAVSSFGMGGTNVHVILEEAPPRPPSGPAQPWQLLPLSAKTLKSLDRRKERLRDDLRTRADEPLADIAYTLQTGRERFQHNYCLLARSTGEALSVLSTGYNAQAGGVLWDGMERRTVFMFPGQGAQYPDMARALYEREPVFRQEFDACAAVLERRCGWRLHDLVFTGPETGEDAEALLNRTRHTQPALFTIEYALARWLMALGIVPEALIGHSVGEYVAAALAGVMTRDDALALVAERGRLIDELPPGSMLFVPLPEHGLARYLEGDLDLAVVNAPEVSILSGPTPAIENLARRLEGEGIKSRVLRTSHAFHSRMMDPVLPGFARAVGAVPLSAPRIPIMSNLTGTWLTADEATRSEYWVKHLRNTVRFCQGIEKLAQSTPAFFLEVGPGSGLSQFCRQILGAQQTRHIVEATLPRPAEGLDAQFTALSALGRLWQHGAPVDWQRLHEGETRNRLPLAGYPFAGGSYWADLKGAAKSHDAAAGTPEAWFQCVTWRQWLEEAPRLPEIGQLLVVHADPVEVGQAVQTLAGRCRRTVLAYTGPGFARNREGDFVVGIGNEEDYDRLFAEASLDPAEVLDLVCVYPGVASEPAAATAQFIAFLKSLVRYASGRTAPLRLTVLIPTAYEVVGPERESWDRQLAASLAAIIGGLQPAIAWRVIDVGSVLDRPLDKRRLFRLTKHPAAQSARADRLLASDLGGFAPGTVTAYRNGRRWRRDIQPSVFGGEFQPTRNGGYILTGVLNAFAAELLRRWHAAYGGEFLYLLPPENAQLDSAEFKRTAEQLRAEGLPLSVARSGAIMFLTTKIKRMSEGRELSLWHLNVLPPHSEDEVLVYLNPDNIAELTTGMTQLLSVLGRIPARRRIWFSTVPAFYNHPPNVIQVLPDGVARVAGAAHDWSVVYLPEDLFGSAAESPYVRLDEARRTELIARAIARSGHGQAVVVSALPPGELAWTGRRAADTAAESPEAEGETAAGRYERPELPTPYAAPVTERQKAICAIWQDLFQIDRVGIHDNFFDLGGDSVMALKLLSALEMHFKVQLPLAEVMNAPTVAEQANSVVEYAETSADRRKVSPLVAFRREGGLPPFFCVHPAGGLVHCYVEMSRQLGRDVPFYGFQHPGLDGKSGPYTTYPKMAELYIEAMREVQPRGPYCIGGWSFGGTIAYEMACQLAAAGEEVALLALFDSPGPSALYRLQGRPDFEFSGMIAFLSQALARMFGGEIRVDTDELARIPRERQLDYLVERMVTATGEQDMANAKQALERVIDIFELTDRAEQVYQPPRYDGPLHLYRVQEVSDYEYTAYKDHPQIDSATFGWDQLCGEVIVRFVPGSHMNMIFPPNIEVLAEKLRDDLLARAEAAGPVKSAAA